MARRPKRRVEVFDSKCGDIRVRGTAVQCAEKYTKLADEAAAEKDFILWHLYLQHAHHYTRLHDILRSGDRYAKQSKPSSMGKSLDEDVPLSGATPA